jgi:hypothetical protein
MLNRPVPVVYATHLESAYHKDIPHYYKPCILIILLQKGSTSFVYGPVSEVHTSAGRWPDPGVQANVHPGETSFAMIFD